MADGREAHPHAWSYAAFVTRYDLAGGPPDTSRPPPRPGGLTLGTTAPPGHGTTPETGTALTWGRDTMRVVLYHGYSPRSIEVGRLVFRPGLHRIDVEACAGAFAGGLWVIKIPVLPDSCEPFRLRD